MTSALKSNREKEIFWEYLRKNGFNRTAQKELILSVFLQAEKHLTVEQLHELVRKKDKTLGYITVYRTLNALVECGLARKVDLGDGKTRYEHLYEHPHHHHIICTGCLKTIEFFSAEIEQLQEDIMRLYNFKQQYHHFQIFGLCHECQTEQVPKHEDRTVSDKVFLRDALRTVIDVETKGLSFYQEAAELTQNLRGKTMFRSIARQEEEHLSELQKEYQGFVRKNRAIEQEPVFLLLDRSSLKNIFPSSQEAKRLVPKDADDLQALSIAIESERESYQYFKNFAEKFKDSRGKKIFLQFMEAERDHLLALQREYDRVVQSGRS